MLEPMKSLRSIHQTEHDQALQALKKAIVDGATFDYERLIQNAVQAGVSEHELDLLIHEALEVLIYSEEHPVTSRDLTHSGWPLAPVTVGG